MSVRARWGAAFLAAGGVAASFAQDIPLDPSVRTRAPLWHVIPGKPELSTLYADGTVIEVQTEQRWRFMCGSDLSNVTIDDLRSVADAHEASFKDVVIIDNGGSGRAGNLDVVYSLDSSVPSGAVSGFALAEAYLEAQFSDDITITNTCSFANLGSGVIGATGSNYVNGVSWSTSRSGLQTGKDSDDTLQDFLPTGTTIPVRFDGSSSTITNRSTVDWTRAAYRATVGTTTGNAGSMTYNSTFNFDYDPANGVSGTSFVDIVIHETGHSMGFTSGADFTSQQFEVLDVYRFENTGDVAGEDPATTSDFQTFARLVDFNNPADDVSSDLVTVEYRMSDGDPYQASHFREQTPNIGIMDPAFSGGVSFWPNYMKASDLAMFDAIGFDYPPCDAPDITVQPNPSQSVCSGDQVVLIVSTNAVLPAFQWRKGNTDLVDGPNIVGANLPALLILAATADDAADNYNCVVTDLAASCSTTSNDAEVIVGNSPVIATQPANQTVNAGVSSFFTTTTTEPSILFTFQWRRNGVNLVDGPNILGSQTSFVLVLSSQEADEGTYDCVVTRVDGGCDVITAGATLTVNSCSPPTITQQPTNQTACTGDQVNLSVGTSTGGATFQWRRGTTNLVNGANIAGATTANLTIFSAGGADAGSDYNVIVTAGGCSTTSNNASVTVNADPVITGQPSGQLVCEGSAASFSVTATGSGLTYQWRRGATNLVNGANITGATTANLTILSSGPADVGSDYNVVVTATGGCAVGSNNASLTVNGDPAITTQPASQTVDVGDPVTFSVGVSEPVGNFSFAWRRDGVALSDGGTISGSATDTLEISSAQAADQGDYDCVVTRLSGGCDSLSQSATLTVNTPSGCPNPQPQCDASDIFPAGDGDCLVDLSDLGTLLSHFGGAGTRDDGDVFPVGVGDGVIDLSDLGQMLSDFGADCR